MAASMNACFQRALLACRRSCDTNASKSVVLQFTRWYARGIKRTPVTARDPVAEAEKIKAKGIRVRDPRQNPWVPFVSGDPTQQQFTSKNVNKQQTKGTVSKQQTKGMVSKQQNQQKTANTKKPLVSKIVSKKESAKSSGIQYEKLEDGDKRFSQVMLVARSRRDREKKGIMLLEGRRLIVDALRAGAQPKQLYFSDTSLLSSLPVDLLGDAKLFKVQYKHLKMWADTENPAGLLGIFSKPPPGEVLCSQVDTLPVTLICDQVTDPSNMGTIIRTAAAAGCRRIITSKGSVDVWDPKVLRGGMGGHFYTSILSSLPWEEIINHVASASHICIADSRRDGAVQKSFNYNHPKVLELLHKDGESSSDEEEEEMGRKSLSAGDKTPTEVERGERKLTARDEDIDDDSDDESGQWSRRKSEPFKRVPLSVVPYSDLDCYEAEEVVVIVGGETKGVSAQANKFAFERFGQFVTIPMVESVDSLNTATAAAIVLYEVRRQLTLSQQRVVKKKKNLSDKN